MKMLSDCFNRFTRFGLAGFFAVLGLALVIPDADARRMGGGKSFGRQSQQAAPPAKPAQRDSLGQPGAQPGAQPGVGQAAPSAATRPAAQAPAAGNRFLGPLAGLAAGLGIAALLSHLGLMGPFAEFLAAALMVGLLVLAGLFVWRMLRGAARTGGASPQRPMEPAYQTPSVSRVQMPSASADARPGSIAASLGGVGAGVAADTEDRHPGVPAGFDVDGFLRSAKVHFHRLQAAWDRKDVDDLNEFTTPEVLAELRMQLQESDVDGRNEIVDLDAQLLGIEEGASDWLASVRFSGTMRTVEAPAGERFEEIWNLSKRKAGRSGWLLAGVQQLH